MIQCLSLKFSNGRETVYGTPQWGTWPWRTGWPGKACRRRAQTRSFFFVFYFELSVAHAIKREQVSGRSGEARPKTTDHSNLSADLMTVSEFLWRSLPRRSFKSRSVIWSKDTKVARLDDL